MNEPLNLGIPCGARLSWDAIVAAESSERASSEPAGPAKVVAAVATGSLPVPSAEAFARWLMHMTDLNNQLSLAEGKRGNTRDELKLHNYAVAFDTAHTKFRRHMEEANVRQPEENGSGQPHPTEHDKSL